ncbi:Olfactory receptor 9G4 [Chelonia mydas]|uniref:Olfactory receptor 9G4 n=1 Tax=Chelonia mydas TaxID=8469 RepID=M7BCV5_CHEMY|nr:Olfactory receptor 9G4 [Chelonia mydas]
MHCGLLFYWTTMAIQILIGLMHIGFGGVAAVFVGYNIYISISVIGGYPFWGGLFFVISGSLSVAAENHRNTCLVRGSLGMNITSAIFSAIGIILFLTDLIINVSYYWRNYEEAAKGITVMLFLMTILEFSVAVSTSYFACQAICYTPNTLLHLGMLQKEREKALEMKSTDIFAIMAAPGSMADGVIVFMPPNSAGVIHQGQGVSGAISQTPEMVQCGPQQFTVMNPGNQPLGSTYPRCPAEQIAQLRTVGMMEIFLKSQPKTLGAIQILIGLIHIGFGGVSTIFIKYIAVSGIVGYPFCEGIFLLGVDHIHPDQIGPVSTCSPLVRCRTMASMEPAQITAAVMSIVNISRVILQYVQNQNLQKQARRRQQRGDESDEDMDTDFAQSTGPGNLDILVAMGEAHAVECHFWARETSTDWWDRIVLQVKSSRGMNNTSAIFSSIGIILFLTELILNTSHDHKDEEYRWLSAGKGITGMLLLLSILEFSIAVSTSYFATQAIRYTPNTVMPMETTEKGSDRTLVTQFILVGFTTEPHLQVALFVLFLISYSLTLIGNLGLMTLIFLDPCLHTPMYFFVSSLSFLDICECFLLAAMAYDRDVAICNPLVYASAMPRKLCFQLVASSYTAGFANAIMHTGNTFHLRFCGDNTINHYFCDAPPLVKMACDDTRVYELILATVIGCNVVATTALILGSYTAIGVAILRIRSATGRPKAFSTCSAHLVSVTLFYGSILFMYSRPSSQHTPEWDKVGALFYTVVRPLVNPMIYSLRNKDVKEALRKAFGRATASK